MKTKWILLGAVLAFAACEKNEALSAGASNAGATEGRPPLKNLVAAYERGMADLRRLRQEHRDLKAEELKATKGKHFTNSAALRQLEASIATFDSELSKLKVQIEQAR